MKKLRRINNKLCVIVSFSSFMIFLLACLKLRVTPTKLIGAAFCHQIPSRSPEFGFPFCYRCSGLFSGITTGILCGLLWRTNPKPNFRRIMLMFTISFVIFITDILNSSKFSGFNLYKETIYIRFLSAFPLGYAISLIIVRIMNYLFLLKNTQSSAAFLGIGFCFICGAFFSYAIIFSHNVFVLRIAGMMLSIMCLLFLTELYTILTGCFLTIFQKKLSFYESVLIGSGMAFLQITILGGAHIRFFPFDHIFYL